MMHFDVRPEPAPLYDREMIRSHVEMVHHLARGAGSTDGVLTLTTIEANPLRDNDGTPRTQQFSIGDVENHIAAIVGTEGSPNLNCYVPMCIFKRSLGRGKKGSEGDVEFWLAGVADMDNDNGKGGALPLEAPYIVQSSELNTQAFYPLSHALPPQGAKLIAIALGDAIGCDPRTKDTSGVFRVAGTLNWPNKRKLDRGRSPVPQLVTVAKPWSGDCVEPDVLKAAVAKFNTAKPVAPALSQSTNAKELYVSLPAALKKLVAAPPLPDEDRSAVAYSVILKLMYRNISDAGIVALFNAYPIGERYNTEGRNLAAELRRAREWKEAHPVDETPPTPIDLWGKLNSPALPPGLLPGVLEHFAIEQARMMGADPAGLAMAALAVCGAAVPDRVALQVKRHDPTWTENTRLWVALIGDPSTKKTPMLRQAVRPISRIDGEMVRAFLAEKARYDALPAEDRKQIDPPKKTRLRIEDITIEAAQEVLKDSHDGVLCLQDEMTGWFASMDKYSGRGAGKDRAFWLQAYTGGEFVSDRVSRGTCYIPNLSISLVGGIQPEPLRKIVDDTVDDGLIQRLIPILLRPATVGLDEPQGEIVAEYERLIEMLRGSRSSIFGAHEPRVVLVHFSDAALVVRERMAQWHIDLASCVGLSRKLAAHVGKYDGVFARLCLIWHCIERAKGGLINQIDERTALRVEEFMRKFLLPHAVSFYTGALQQADDHERLSSVAGYILERKLEVITDRDIARGDSTMRGLTKTETSSIFEQLSALGWLLEQIPGPRPSSPPRWRVNPICHELFAERAKMEADRRRAAREALQEVFRAQ
jgi:hypothetical protein